VSPQVLVLCETIVVLRVGSRQCKSFPSTPRRFCRRALLQYCASDSLPRVWPHQYTLTVRWHIVCPSDPSRETGCLVEVPIRGRAAGVRGKTVTTESKVAGGQCNEK
jgi:hypothetical protein